MAMKELDSILIIIVFFFNFTFVTGICAQNLVLEAEKENLVLKAETENGTNKNLSHAVNNFTFNLFKTLIKDNNKNSLFFPLNIVKLLLMVSLGSSNTLASQIQNAIETPLFETNFHTDIHNYFYDWKKSRKSQVYLAVDQIFVNSSVDLRFKYQRILKMFYPHAMKIILFSKAVNKINSLIASKTHGFIRSIASETDIDLNMRLLLWSVVFFSGDWSISEISTSKDNPSTIELNSEFDSEHIFASVNYRKDFTTNFELVELPIGNQSISFLLVVPSQENENPKTLAKTITKESFSSWINLQGFQKTRVILPKLILNLQDDLNLNQVLPKLGITNLFTQSNSLEKMSDEKKLFVNRFVQKSFLKIHYKSTGKGMRYENGGGIRIRLKLPYFFFVVDKNADMVISAGSVVN